MFLALDKPAEVDVTCSLKILAAGANLVNTSGVCSTPVPGSDKINFPNSTVELKLQEKNLVFKVGFLYFAAFCDLSRRIGLEVHVRFRFMFVLCPGVSVVAELYSEDINESPRCLFISESTLVLEVFFRREENIKRQTKKWREKTSGYPRCESHYHATIAVNQHHEID